ncbi:MAG TPA: type II secretion system protein, partial [Thermoanaerobaculaceae bacterium]|nr:type II secretion system protein [Thermoanaerobaculaceae bacterium]
MSHSSRSGRGAAGFSLIEMLVVVACLGMIFWISAQLLFPMRTAAERQRLQVEARQTARSAADYMTYILRGATDGLPPPRTPGSAPLSPLALVIWVLDKDAGSGADNGGCPGTDCVQLSYNNVTAAGQLGDPGTDIITVGQFEEPVISRAALWPGYASGADAYWFFEMGCGAYEPPDLPGGDDTDNFDRFEDVTGAGSVVGPGGQQWSKPLIVYDDASNWSFYQIVDYHEAQNDKTCTNPDATRCLLSGDRRPCLWVNASPGPSAISSPGGHRTINEPVYMSTAVRFLSFRVCNGWLQQ